MRRNKPYPTRIPVGRLELKIPGEIRKFRARLKLYSAEARIIIETIRGERIEINTLIAMNQNILIVKINNKNISVEITPPKYDEETRKLLGGQAIGGETIAGRINVVATALHAGLSIDDLYNIDLGYSPPFAPVWDPIVIASSVAMRDLAKKSKHRN